MSQLAIIFAIIIIICTYLNKLSDKTGVPALLMFILLGILFGWSEDTSGEVTAHAVETICSVSLIFIMFFGGFGTRWKSAKPVAIESGLLATIGVFLTAGFVGAFCHFILKWQWAEALLMGSVISSTDAASVFSILRKHNLGLRRNTAPLLEIESGSNDPCSYMLTAVMMSVLNGGISGGQVVWMIFSQLVFGAASGLVIATAAVFIMRRKNFDANGFDSLMIVAFAILAYYLPGIIGGNGYLSCYIVGIVLGNSDFTGRKSMVHFFSGITNLMQMLLFYLLGYMCIPAKLPSAILPALAIFLFLTIIARPLAVSAILIPFRYKMKQIGLISFVGLRGAASIVFAISTITSGTILTNDIFSIVLCLVLVSIALQGSLIPPAAKAFDMIDKRNDIMATFSDFQEKNEVVFGAITLNGKSPWNGKKIKELILPGSILFPLIIRGSERLAPNGETVLQEGDKIITCSESYNETTAPTLIEHQVSDGSKWIGTKLCDFPDKNHIIVMIRRKGHNVIPNGNTAIRPGDTLISINRDEI